MILDAVVPLLAEYGSDLTSRQIAEGAGIAEGTVFRAFGDKDTLLRAAAEQYFDEAVVLDELHAIDPAADLESKLVQVLTLMHRRFQGALRVMSALGDSRPAEHAEQDAAASRLIERLFAADAARLAWTPEQLMHLVRLLAFASSVPEIAASDAPFTNEQLAHILVRGVRTPSAVGGSDA